MKKSAACFCALVVTFAAQAQLAFDPDFDTGVEKPAYPIGEGPAVLIDEGHNNWHTAEGGYKPFAEMLRNDGYRVSTHEGTFTAGALQGADVVVIASAIADGVTADPSTWLPWKSAFTSDEIAVLVDRVRGGGALLLVVDYMPFPGWAADLAAAFGVHLLNGYAYEGNGENHLAFSRTAGNLRSHPITDGRSPGERIELFRTYAGTALLPPYGAEPLLLLGESAYAVIPEQPLPGDVPPPRTRPDTPSPGGLRAPQ